MDEARARQVVLVRAFDATDTPLWTPEDRAWASRLAVETASADATPEQLLAERARHALQRLAPRDPGVRRWLAQSLWRWPWLLGAAALAGLTGLMADLLGRSSHIDLLTPPVWGVIAWNLVVYLLLLVGLARRAARPTGGLRRRLLAAWQRLPTAGPLRAAAAHWAQLSAPLQWSRASALLHTAAAALALGLIASLYLRGLVFDFRVGWQSTFLDAASVRQWLAALLAPASAVTGIGVPGTAAIEAMRLTPAAPQGQASAAPWIHLFATTLALFVVGPRLVLALAALLQAFMRARALVVPIDDPALEPLLRRHRGGPPLVRLLPYAAPPGAQAALGLRAMLARIYGDELQLQMAEVTPIGDEEAAAGRAAAAPATLRVVLVELGATPEVEHHGRLLKALREVQTPAPLLLVVDEAAFLRRFAGIPARADERRAAWRSFAAEHDVRACCIDLESPDPAPAEAALKQALQP